MYLSLEPMPRKPGAAKLAVGPAAPGNIDARRQGGRRYVWRGVPTPEDAMFERVLKQMRDKIRTRLYVMTVHAEEEMDEDGLAIFDVERCILTGEIVHKQKDPETKEWKYVVKGHSVRGDEVITVTKLAPTGKLVIITVYAA
jgi:hypothetical protein